VEERQARKEKRNLIPNRHSLVQGRDAFTLIAITLSHSLRGERSGYHFTFIESSVDVTGLRYPKK